MSVFFIIMTILIFLAIVVLGLAIMITIVMEGDVIETELQEISMVSKIVEEQRCMTNELKRVANELCWIRGTVIYQELQKEIREKGHPAKLSDRLWKIYKSLSREEKIKLINNAREGLNENKAKEDVV